MDKMVITAPEAPEAAGGYAQALLVSGASRQLYISGQIPSTRDGTVPESFAEQSRLVWRNIEAQLHAGGMTLDNLVKVTTFLSDRRYAAESRQSRKEILGDRKVALSVVIAGIFDEAWLLEIEAIAAA
ncbi:RidA family protein [Bosea sp. BIWAKO-01]|uniref:RidA family protein n=1 Tax=Bosea sp. BIWAKO-01 TaxID=506668 RepID=UPI000852F993|nr:RidA family protein [Bosea sp. BIWAKO-01]GAU84068.1 endoribonuclease L-PSP [Bosea sp. BIWAKO-01]